jgi:hypothetical protein
MLFVILLQYATIDNTMAQNTTQKTKDWANTPYAGAAGLLLHINGKFTSCKLYCASKEGGIIQLQYVTIFMIVPWRQLKDSVKTVKQLLWSHINNEL